MANSMKTLLLGILLIVVLGFGGFVYRNAVEHPLRPIACPMDASICPDGTSVGRVGNSCTFAPCQFPNITLDTLGVSFAIPAGFEAATSSDITSVANYEMSIASSTGVASIAVHRYLIAASSTALATIRETAISGVSGMPAPATAFSSSVFGSYRFTVVSLERFEGVIDTAYYLARNTDVLRFDAVDRGVLQWTDQTLDTAVLPAHAALLKLLASLQGD